MMRMQRVAGLILISTRSDIEHGARLMAEIAVPTVLMGSVVLGTPYDSVSLDDVEAGRLIDLGHHRIAIIGGREGVSSHEERLEGCRLAFAQRGLILPDENVILANFTAELAFEETLRLLATEPMPTAIVALSNFMTVGVMRALAQINIGCPKDVSIIGIDDLDWADIMSPRPTLIAQPIGEMTRTAIATLLEEIETAKRPNGRRVLFEPRLITRDSCGPAPVRPGNSQAL
jgi:DNA-binding LacI/PurR family transcriptional regulator